MTQLKVTQVGNSVGLVLPKEALYQLRVKTGDTIYLVESESGYTMKAIAPEFATEMELADETSRKFRHAVKELAK